MTSYNSTNNQKSIKIPILATAVHGILFATQATWLNSHRISRPQRHTPQHRPVQHLMPTGHGWSGLWCPHKMSHQCEDSSYMSCKYFDLASRLGTWNSHVINMWGNARQFTWWPAHDCRAMLQSNGMYTLPGSITTVAHDTWHSVLRHLRKVHLAPDCYFHHRPGFPRWWPQRSFGPRPKALHTQSSLDITGLRFPTEPSLRTAANAAWLV